MTTFSKWTSLSLLFLLFTTGCGEDPLALDSEVNAPVDVSEYDGDFVENPMSAEEIAYLDGLPQTNMREFQREIDNLQLINNRAQEVWGTGVDHKVYKRSGSGFFQPNPTARLKYVEVGAYGDGVWGIKANNKIFKWNGSTWVEPNPAASLYNITALSSSIAVGLGWLGKIYVTYNGGTTWSRFGTIEKVRWLSAGSNTSNILWGVNDDQELIFYDYSTSTWEVRPTSFDVGIVTTIPGSGAWATRLGVHDVFKSVDGFTFSEPNPAANVVKISSVGDELKAWGLGTQNQILRTTNGGATWVELFPGSGLFHITAN